MSGKGDCYDNAVVETFFKTLKAELIWRHTWHTRRQVEGALFQYISGFYNLRRRHSTLAGKSPLDLQTRQCLIHERDIVNGSTERADVVQGRAERDDPIAAHLTKCRL